MSDRWDGWDGIGYHRSSKSTFVANNLNFKGFVHIDWIVKFQTLLWCCLENGRESSTMWRLKANWKGRAMVVDKDKGLPLPADSGPVKPNKLFWLPPKLFVFVHPGQTERDNMILRGNPLPRQMYIVAASDPPASHFPCHVAAHS